MTRSKGFALATTLVLTMVMASMAWALLEFSSKAHFGALYEEPRIRCFHAAEAGVRYYMAYKEAKNFELNDCEVIMVLTPTALIVTASTKRGEHQIRLHYADGYVTRRTSSAR